MKTRIVLAGGSGLIGQSLARLLLAKGYEVIVLTRSPSHQEGQIRCVQWDGKAVGDWAQFVDGAGAIVNLTGRTINCRHTPENRREIIDSRVDSVRVLGQAVGRSSQPPRAFVQSSGISIYGDTGDRWCDENAPPSDDFLARVCQLWEEAFEKVNSLGMRKSVLRIAPVLSPNGGFLTLLGGLTRWFLGGHIGDGRQFISWIHIADVSQMFLWAIERNEIAGIFNATTPYPVTNAELMRELRCALHRPWSPPVPKWALPIGSRLMGTEASLAVTSCRTAPKHFVQSGFTFEFPELRQALANIYPNK
jgi:uncharacterized protein (TIGR01777 family)